MKIDRLILTPAHLYQKEVVDPEGLLSTVSAMAHCLIGFCFGSVMARKDTDSSQRLLQIMACGFALLLIGLALEQIMPINKRVWSPTYTLVTCSLDALALGALGYFTDVKGYASRLWPFEVYGVNPLFLYVLSEVAAIVLDATSSTEYIFSFLHTIIPHVKLAALTFSLIFAAAIWLVGLPLYKRNIYIKI